MVDRAGVPCIVVEHVERRRRPEVGSILVERLQRVLAYHSGRVPQHRVVKASLVVTATARGLEDF